MMKKFFILISIGEADFQWVCELKLLRKLMVTNKHLQIIK